jgi:sugar phosphate isomerase/epimerase
MNNSFSRRHLVKTGILAAIGSTSLSKAGAVFEQSTNGPYNDNAPWGKFKVGIASYTFRKMSVDNTIKATQRLGLEYISIKDFHLPLTSSLEERQSVIQKFKTAGITPLSCGNITMENDEGNIRNAFQYAKDCNLPTIVCSPHPDSMPVLDKMVKEYDIKLAIHNHGPEDNRFPSPYDVWNAVKKFDKRIGLCIDVGHTARAKVNPAEAIVKCKDRLYDLHFKDINSTQPDGNTIQAGRGVLDLSSVWRALLSISYPYLLSFEYEPSADDPLPDVAETVGYSKGLLRGILNGRK